jgi:hypothetical protein
MHSFRKSHTSEPYSEQLLVSVRQATPLAIIVLNTSQDE